MAAIAAHVVSDKYAERQRAQEITATGLKDVARESAELYAESQNLAAYRARDPKASAKLARLLSRWSVAQAEADSHFKVYYPRARFHVKNVRLWPWELAGPYGRPPKHDLGWRDARTTEQTRWNRYRQALYEYALLACCERAVRRCLHVHSIRVDIGNWTFNPGDWTRLYTLPYGHPRRRYLYRELGRWLLQKTQRDLNASIKGAEPDLSKPRPKPSKARPQRRAPVRRRPTQQSILRACEATMSFRERLRKG